MAQVLDSLTDFDTLLDASGTLGVAVSGGGDSVALLYALAEWGRRPLHVFCVDHQIQPQSQAWTETVARHAEGLGVPFTGLCWDGEKPSTGVSAAARQARHALLADAARAEGIGVLCLAHTADDVAEARMMRAQGSSVGTPRLWSPSPAWPQGRGVTLCRPLLHVSRACLRDYLRERNVTWIDDPANESETSLRAQARKALQGGRLDGEVDLVLPLRSEVMAVMAEDAGLEGLGVLRFRAAGLAALTRETAVKLMAAAAVSAGGGDRLPRRHSVETVLAGLAGGKVHTLCGARIRQQGDVIQVVREAGEMARNPNPTQGAMWDGRFELMNTVFPVVASGPVRRRLDRSAQRFLTTLPAELRAILPVVEADAGPVLAHLLSPDLYETVKDWVLPRFLNAVCRIERETDL